MNRSQAVLALTLASLALPITASAATAGDDAALSAFQTICADTTADFPAVLKAADAAGFTEANLIADADPTLTVTDKDGREKSVGGATLRMLAIRGTKTSPGGQLTLSTCKISTDKADNGLLAKAQSWLGIPTDSSDKGMASYLVTVNGGARTPLTHAQIGASLSAGGAHILKFQEDAASASLVYQKFTK
ncbi:MAG: hypothetical protein ACHP7N_07385 [Caulobacterales bacterium]